MRKLLAEATSKTPYHSLAVCNDVGSLFLPMATFQAVKKAVNIAPTVRVLPSGTPVAPLLNLKARSPSDGHGHHHGAAIGPRVDVPPKWIGGVSKTSSGLVSKTFLYGKIYWLDILCLYHKEL